MSATTLARLASDVRGCLDAEPLVHDEWIVRPLGVELIESLDAFVAVLPAERTERGNLIRHVIRGAETSVRHRRDFRRVQVRQVSDARILERSRRAVGRFVGILFGAVRGDRRLQIIAEFGGERRHDKLAREACTRRLVRIDACPPRGYRSTHLRTAPSWRER